MTLKAELTEATKTAMKAKNKEDLRVIRMIMAAIKRIEVDERIEVDDARVLQILEKLRKQSQESIVQFRDAGRDDLVAKEEQDVAVITRFLPTPLSPDEIDAILKECIEESGATGPQDMGKVMKLLKPRVQGRADMSTLSQEVKARLG